MMKERLETKLEFAGKEYWPTMVGTVVEWNYIGHPLNFKNRCFLRHFPVVEWNTETGATHEIRCTSAMVACIFRRIRGV